MIRVINRRKSPTLNRLYLICRYCELPIDEDQLLVKPVHRIGGCKSFYYHVKCAEKVNLL